MKILLVFPNIQNAEYADFAPLGILYVAAVLKQRGHKILVIDNLVEQNNDEALLEKINNFIPQVIGISCNVLQAPETYRLARLIKKDNLKIIAGGPHATIMFRQILNECKEIDYCVLGEGENTLLELVGYLGDKNGGIENIPGIAFRKNGEVVKNAERELVKDLDTIPYPAYDLIDLNRYHSFPIATVLTSRGCPFECIFCSNSVFGKTNRQRTIKNILGEIELLVDKYHCQAIDFHDDTFNLNRNRAYELAQVLISNGFHKKIRWSAEARVNRNLFDKELIAKFKESGCRLISFGIESGSDEIIENIKKRINKDEVRTAIKLCKEAGVNTRAFFMIGNLGEKIQDVFRSIKFATELSCSATQFTIATPFPGSVFYNMAKEKGWIKTQDYSLYNEKNATIRNEYLTAADLTALKNLADFFMLLKGNNLEIFATSLLLENKKTLEIKKKSIFKIMMRIPKVRHFIKSGIYLLRYLVWLKYNKEESTR